MQLESWIPTGILPRSVKPFIDGDWTVVLSPGTTDPILSKYRFTNPYRVADRVSQYLLKNVIYDRKYSDVDLFFRILLFKLFNKIETWELLKSAFGELTFSNYHFSRFDKVLTDAMISGRRIYSAAYIMPSGGKRYARKHRAHLRSP